MSRFDTPKEAFVWAVEEYERRGSARAIMYDPDWEASKGIQRDFSWLDALTIIGIAKKHDRSNGKVSWFVAYYMPIPIIEQPRWTEREMEELLRREQLFECELAAKGYIPHCGNCDWERG